MSLRRSAIFVSNNNWRVKSYPQQLLFLDSVLPSSYSHSPPPHHLKKVIDFNVKDTLRFKFALSNLCIKVDEMNRNKFDLLIFSPHSIDPIARNCSSSSKRDNSSVKLYNLTSHSRHCHHIQSILSFYGEVKAGKRELLVLHRAK